VPVFKAFGGVMPLEESIAFLHRHNSMHTRRISIEINGRPGSYWVGFHARAGKI
jgi:hypothetical protein